MKSSFESRCDDHHQDSPSPPLQQQPKNLCPFFETIVETIVNHLDVDRSSKILNPNTTVLYTLQEGFMPNDRAWMCRMQFHRMNKDVTIVYRHEIVNDLVQQVQYLLATEEMRGMMVTGPPGVGKSYSLVNLTRNLLASGKYLVTLIPDCDQWHTAEDLFNFILESVGVDPQHVGLKYDAKRDDTFDYLIHDIDQLLQQRGMQWVFIFDQINKLFNRDQCRNVRDIGAFSFPFYMIWRVLDPGRIICITSEPTHNNYYYRRNDESFDEYTHPLQLNRDETAMLYSSELVSLLGGWEELEHATGRVPWYLCRWVADTSGYYDVIRNEMTSSLDKLKIRYRNAWDDFVDSGVQCVFHVWSEEIPFDFDRKYLLLEWRGKASTVVALFPFVQEVYRDYFWKNIMDYIAEKEYTLQDSCELNSTTADDRGRLFEHLVIARLYPNGLPSGDVKKILMTANVPLTANLITLLQGDVIVKRIVGKSYPKLSSSQSAITLFLPISFHYPAVDVIIVVGKVVIALQIHVSERPPNMLPLLQRHVKEARWEKDGIHTVILVYLSPNVSTSLKLRRIHQTCSATRWGYPTPTVISTIEYVTLFCSIHEFNVFASLQPYEPFVV